MECPSERRDILSECVGLAVAHGTILHVRPEIDDAPPPTPRLVVYRPVAFFFAVLLVVLLLSAVTVLILGLFSTAFTRVGFSWTEALLILGASWFGSHFNIPIATIRSHRPTIEERYVRAYGMVYRLPVLVSAHRTIVAANVGGALIPALVSLYLLVRFPGSFAYALAATAVVALATHRLARPVRGVGVVIPALVPPIVAAGVTWALTYVLNAPESTRFVTAYVSGTLGTLIGADLLNLGRIAEMDAPVASIGGAGTFDGVFLAGLVAVLLV